MKVTVCELPNEPDKLEKQWLKLCRHVKEQESELVLLPEMPFYRWLANSQKVDGALWEEAVKVYDEWMTRFEDMAPSIVISTRPAINNGFRKNIGYLWDSKDGRADIHGKYYLPDEAGFWEASWYYRGGKDFTGFKTTKGKIGFLICTELWFTKHAREYGKQGVQIIVSPRATPASSEQKWVAGGQAVAVVSGAYSLSSNLSGKTADGCNFAGTGWIIEPDEGKVLGLTTSDKPFLTLDIDLSVSDKAKKTYPRYVMD
jgi:N-carbamoylputrescine amidase